MDMDTSPAESRTYGDNGHPYGYSRGYRRADDLLGAFSGGDWDRSGGGCCCGGGGGGASSYLSDGTLFALLAAAGLAFYILYTAVTAAAGGRRRRRSLPGTKSADGDLFDGATNGLAVEDVLWQGLEEFEEKIERLTDNAGDEDAENSWISGLFNQFSSLYGQDTLTMEDIDGMEPPILDETWDLGVKKRNSGAKKSSVEKENILEKEAEEDIEEANIRAKRSTKEKVSGGRTKCRKEMWRCVSRVVEDSLDYMDKPDGLMGLAQKSMFKIAFHGSMSNAWTGVMSIPEARRVKKCMNAHEKCLGYEAVWAEAKVDKADTNDQAEETDKRRRLIVNPEFVQSLDTSVGVKQYEEGAED